MVQRDLHVIAKIVETEFVIGPVGYIAEVLVLSLLAGGVHIGLDGADRQSEGRINRSHPLGISLG